MQRAMFRASPSLLLELQLSTHIRIENVEQILTNQSWNMKLMKSQFVVAMPGAPSSFLLLSKVSISSR